MRSTTVVCVRRDGKVAMGADGQVTMDKVVLKHGARKLRRLGDVMQRGWGGPVAMNIWAPSRICRESRIGLYA